MAMPADPFRRVTITVSTFERDQNLMFLVKDLIKAGGWFETRYKNLQQDGMNHEEPKAADSQTRIVCGKQEAVTFGYLHKIIISNDQYVRFNEVFPPEQVPWHFRMAALIDVYFLAERLGSDHTQNKIMDTLMVIFRNLQNLNGRPLTWTLTKLLPSGETLSSQLAFFLIDLVAYNWLSDPLQEMNDAIVVPSDGEAGNGSLDAVLGVGNKEVIKRLMCRILQQQQWAMRRNQWAYENPAFKAFCKYHVHREPLTAPCPGEDL